ncbi:pseudaminic acid biosynthesis-associated methylase [Vampirovibrio sp.]|uniref:pseudaminic acid biosynthesis-associated methylase n=1 Tax=Vampirovibrio sp. TaxID=2717857 RepID=UPI003593BCEC
MAESTRIKSEQEQFWEGEFGSTYTVRNAVQPEQRTKFFGQILKLAPGVQSVCELGANKGHNLLAIHSLNPEIQLTGLELNPNALAELKSHAGLEGVQGSIQTFNPNRLFDLVYTCGVLIHLNPDDLTAAYQKMCQLSNRYILINEYYNPSPVELGYRGHEGKLFKRDFGGEFWDANEGQVKLVDYGFLWQRVEPSWDNSTWWLFEKI